MAGLRVRRVFVLLGLAMIVLAPSGRAGAEGASRVRILPIGAMRLVFSPDGKLLALGSSRRGRASIAIWDVSRARIVRWVGDGLVAGYLTWSSDGRHLVASCVPLDGAHTRRIVSWSTGDWRREWSREVPGIHYTPLCVSPDNSTVAVAEGLPTGKDPRDEYYVTAVLDLMTGERIRRIEEPGAWVCPAGFDARTGLLVCSITGDTVGLWDAAGKLVRRVHVPRFAGTFSLSVRQRTSLLVGITSGQPDVWTLDLSTGVLTHYPGLPGSVVDWPVRSGLWPLAVVGPRTAHSRGKGTMDFLIYDPARRRPIGWCGTEWRGGPFVALSPDCSLVAVSADRVELWRIDGGSPDETDDRTTAFVHLADLDRDDQIAQTHVDDLLLEHSIRHYVERGRCVAVWVQRDRAGEAAAMLAKDARKRDYALTLWDVSQAPRVSLRLPARATWQEVRGEERITELLSGGGTRYIREFSAVRSSSAVDDAMKRYPTVVGMRYARRIYLSMYGRASVGFDVELRLTGSPKGGEEPVVLIAQTFEGGQSVAVHMVSKRAEPAGPPGLR